MQTLLNHWLAAAGRAGAPDEGAVARAGAELLERWREPHRHYHNLAHLTAVLAVVDAEATAAADPDSVRLAAWFHDAVYDPRAGGDDNERRSAALAARVLAGLGLPRATVAEVERLVLLTAGHRVDPDDCAGALLCDADLAILAAPAASYDRYAAAVRHEYGHLSDPVFRAGRAAVLRQLLDLPTLYRVPALAARWEGPARANLTRELGLLAAPRR